MQHANVIPLSRYRDKEKRERQRVNKGKNGSVYARNDKLWIDFRYLGERVREPSGLADTPENKARVRKQLNLITAEIANGLFVFGDRFPHSTKIHHFAELEGKTVTKKPEEVTFGEYVKQWRQAMEPGMTSGQKRDYQGLLNCYILPFFANRPFSEFTSVLTKKFLASLKSTTSRLGKPLSAKTIRNIMIPLRVITKDACDEYGWFHLPDPFSRVKLPKPTKCRVRPFNFQEWELFIEHVPEWYRPYFNFAVQTGLRPSEQVALKWHAIDEEFIHIELSRVRKEEKEDLKTHESHRMIQLRPTLRKILAQQKGMTKGIKSPYVFLNMHGIRITQENLRSVWELAMKKSDLDHRRMYETRHTFASWALALGETPEWVARTLGHVDTSMVYRTYGRYIPNLTRKDGSAFEGRFSDPQNTESNQTLVTISHNYGHNCTYGGCLSGLTT